MVVSSDLTSELDESERLASCSGRFIPGEGAPSPPRKLSDSNASGLKGRSGSFAWNRAPDRPLCSLHIFKIQFNIILTSRFKSLFQSGCQIKSFIQLISPTHFRVSLLHSLHFLRLSVT